MVSGVILTRRVKLLSLASLTMLETILILVVLIALVVIFKSQLTRLVGDIFEKITNQALRI